MRPILLVEDHFITQDLVRLFLERNGFDVICANNAAMAIELSQHTKFSVMIVDLGLPDMDGIELLPKLRATKLNAHSTFIAMTAQPDLELKQSCVKAGYEDLLSKPLTELDHIGKEPIISYLKNVLSA